MSEEVGLCEELRHGMNCDALSHPLDGDCTCGLEFRIHLQTEQTMHAAWRKRADEAEAKVAELESVIAGQKLYIESCQGALTRMERALREILRMGVSISDAASMKALAQAALGDDADD